MRRVIFIAGLGALAYDIRTLIISGTDNTMILWTIITVGLFAYCWFYERLVKLLWLNIAIAAGIAVFLGFVTFLHMYGIRDTATYTEDAALVLGGGIRGERVLRSLAMRLDKAAEYYHKNPNAVLIVSGGQGPSEDIPEALAMERYLIDLGVPPRNIVRDDEALSTYENMVYSKTILDGLFDGEYTAVCITSGFHMFRSVNLARDAGMEVTRLHSGTPWYLMPVNFIREAAAVIKYWIIKK